MDLAEMDRYIERGNKRRKAIHDAQVKANRIAEAKARARAKAR